MILLTIVVWMQYHVLCRTVVQSMARATMEKIAQQHSLLSSYQMRLHDAILRAMEYQHNAELHLNQSHRCERNYHELQQKINILLSLHQQQRRR